MVLHAEKIDQHQQINIQHSMKNKKKLKTKVQRTFVY
jgi:hypothetical protein